MMKSTQETIGVALHINYMDTGGFDSTLSLQQKAPTWQHYSQKSDNTLMATTTGGQTEGRNILVRIHSTTEKDTTKRRTPGTLTKTREEESTTTQAEV